MTLETLIIFACACWYPSYVLSSTHGPGGIFEWIREHVWHGRRGQRFVITSRDPITNEMKVDREIEIPKNGLLDCPICLSFWVALVIVTVTIQHVDIVQTLAVAGLAMLLHGVTGWRYVQ